MKLLRLNTFSHLIEVPFSPIPHSEFSRLFSLLSSSLNADEARLQYVNNIRMFFLYVQVISS